MKGMKTILLWPKGNRIITKKIDIKINKNFLKSESLKSLKEELKKINISLVIGIDNPEKLISKIIDRYNINIVYLQDEWTQDEKNEDNFLKNKNIDLYKYNDQFLFHPEDVDLKNISNVFTNFRKYCEKKLQVRECFVLKTKMDKTNMIDIDYNILYISERTVLY